MALKETKTTLVVSGPGRLSYAHLHEPASMQEGNALKYSVRFMWDKDDTETTAKFKSAVAAAIALGVPKCWKDATKLPKSFINPVIDGDAYNEEREAEGKDRDSSLDGMLFVNCKSDSKPGLLKRFKGMAKPVIIGDDEKALVYSGAFARVSVNCFPYNNKAVGVGAGLNNVCVIGGGAPFGGGSDGISDFSDGTEFEDDGSGADDFDPEA